MVVAGGSERNGGGAGGSSFISGHKGCIAIASATSTTPLINTTSTDIDVKYSYHYSGKIFNETSMIAGNANMPTYDGTTTMIGNTGNGYAKITFLEPIYNKIETELAFSGLSDFRKLEEADCVGYKESWGSYSELYGGNNNELQYNADGSLEFDEDNPVLYLELEESQTELFDESYSMYFTIKADTYQSTEGYQSSGFGGTIASIGNGNTQYKSWISVFRNYLHIYSYYSGPSKTFVENELVEPGFCSFNIEEYSNKIMNIQIVAAKDGETRVYINGELKINFPSGGAEIPTTHVTIGDLRPLRNLKFIGTIYDFSMYDTELTSVQIRNNWNYAKDKWMNK